MKIADIRALSDADLLIRRRESKEEIFNLRVQQQTGSLERPSRLNELRKIIAMVETVRNERRLGLQITSREPARKGRKKKAVAAE
ncbi:MAG: 50S ribosomal protein L29 [Verrucomicrobiota bacterium]